MTVVRWPNHLLHRRRDHTDPEDSETCQACILSLCKVCGGAEASMPTQCPGERMGYDLEQQVMRQEVDYDARRGWYSR